MIWFQGQVDRLVAEKDARIKQLESELSNERLRAEKAIDQLLIKNAVSPLVEPEVREKKETKKEYLELLSVVGEEFNPKETRVG